MRTVYLLIIGLLLMTLAGCVMITRPTDTPAAASAPNVESADYGRPVTFRAGRSIRYPDFTLTYLGERFVISENPPRTFSLQDFRATQNEEEAAITWSSGLGDIAPAIFTMGGHDYLLELAFSDELGQLAENELVVWRKAATPTAISTPAPQDDSDQTVALDQPFGLRRRQQANLEGEELVVELRRVLADSRCPVNELGQRMTCTWLGEGVVELIAHLDGASRQRVVLGTANRAAPKWAEVGDFTIQLLDLTPLPAVDKPQPTQEEYTALLQISQRSAPPVETPVPTPTATTLPEPTPTTYYEIEIIIDCDRLTGEDAEAVLGESVSRDGLMLNFFCLESSVEPAGASAPDDFPFYLGDYQDRNVVAATQWGVSDSPDPLLDLAERVRRANPTADSAYPKLLTYYAVGSLADAFAQLPVMAEGAQGLHVEMVDGLGEAALWLWQGLPDGRHFAALLTLERGKYIVVYALVRPEQTEDAAQEGMITISQRMNGQ
jgi:hypothetical protein